MSGKNAAPKTALLETTWIKEKGVGIHVFERKILNRNFKKLLKTKIKNLLEKESKFSRGI